MINRLLIVVKLAAMWILIITHVLIVHRILLLWATKSWVSIWRLELLNWLRLILLEVRLVHLLLLIMRGLVWWSWIRHLHR